MQVRHDPGVRRGGQREGRLGSGSVGGRHEHLRRQRHRSQDALRVVGRYGKGPQSVASHAGEQRRRDVSPLVQGPLRRVERGQDHESGPRGRNEADEGGHVVDHRVAPGRRIHLLRGTGLPRHDEAGDRRAAARAAADDQLEHRREGVDRVGLEHPSDDDGLCLLDDLPGRVLDALHDERLHQVAAVGHRGARHRHLQRCDAHLLTERHRRQRQPAPTRGGLEKPPDSPGRSTPVGSPKPNARM